MIQKWDSFEIDKPIVISSRGKKLKNLTFYDKWNIQKIMFALKLRLMNHSLIKSLEFWDTYVETISKRNAQGSISILEKVSIVFYILYYTKIIVVEINI